MVSRGSTVARVLLYRPAMKNLRSLSFRLVVMLGLVGIALTATGCPDEEPCILYCN